MSLKTLINASGWISFADSSLPSPCSLPIRLDIICCCLLPTSSGFKFIVASRFHAIDGEQRKSMRRRMQFIQAVPQTFAIIFTRSILRAVTVELFVLFWDWRRLELVKSFIWIVMDWSSQCLDFVRELVLRFIKKEIKIQKHSPWSNKIYYVETNCNFKTSKTRQYLQLSSYS